MAKTKVLVTDESSGKQLQLPVVSGTSLLHLHVNRGKKSLCLDLKQPESIDILMSLLP